MQSMHSYPLAMHSTVGVCADGYYERTSYTMHTTLVRTLVVVDLL